MAERIKLKVSIEKLSFEYEGTREVGQALQAGISRSLAALVDTQRTAMLPGPIDVSTPPNHHGNGNGEETPPAILNRPTESPRKPRKFSGVSLINLLRDLKKEAFFTEPRSVETVAEKLKAKGHTNFPIGRIGARLLDLTKKNEMHRSILENVWLYKDSPFNESPGTTNASE